MSIRQGNNIISGTDAGDGKSITRNSSSQLQTIGVIDQSDNNTALKYWSGTRVEYEALAVKDPNTFYNVTDDFDARYNKGFLGQIIQSPIPLSDAGLYPLNGDVITGTGMYSEFVDYIAGLYDELLPQTTTEYNVDIVGSLTNTDGVLSGFSSSKYAKIPKVIPLINANNLEFVFKFTYNTSSAIQSIFTENNASYFSQVSILANGKIYTQLSNNHSSNNIGTGTGTTTLTSGNTYYVKFAFTGSAYKVYLSTTGAFSGEESEEISITSSAKLLTFKWNIGCSALSSYEQPFSAGSIDLNESYININGSRWWSGTSQVMPCFCTEEEWQSYINEYGVCGKFVYDSTNNTVRLPKYNSKIYTGGGTAPVVGNGTTLGWTDGTHNGGSVLASAGYGLYASGGYNIAVGATTNENASTMNTNKAVGITTDPTKSGLIAQLSDITTSLDGYYYIVVATTTKTNAQVNIDQIASDLSNKVGKDSLQEVYPIIETYSNGTSGYYVRSDGFCEQWGYTGVGTVTFLKPFINTNYNITLGLTANSGDAYSCLWNNKTTTSFYFHVGSGRHGDWKASGYIS